MNEQTPSAPLARILAIAGSDSGGGAGIQADIKTITMLGGYAMTAITAVTVQNTLGVSAIHPVPPAIVAAQITAVLSDIGADAIKIGMLGDTETIAAVADAIKDFAGPVVLDPVMIAKGGAALLPADATTAMREHLLTRATLLTPNGPELEALTGLTVAKEADLPVAARALLAEGAQAVLAKGGHIPGSPVVDWLVTPQLEQRFTAERMDTRHTHGTGCTLASAVTTQLALGLPLPAAVDRGRAYLLSALAAAPGLGGGHGPLDHGFSLR